MNITNMAMRYLGPVVANKIASSLGINNSIATKLISAALPSILAMFVGKSTTSGGAGALFDLIKSDKVASPSGLDAILDGDGAGDFAQAGGGLLGDLLGGNAMGGLAGALGKYAGTGQAETEGLLGLVGPVALGTLQEHANDQGLDAAGLASFLSDQKSNIAASVPAEFAPDLQSSGLLSGIDIPGLGGLAAGATALAEGAAASTSSAADAVTGAVGAAGEKVGEMAEAAATYAPEAPEMPKSGGMMKWIIGAVVLLGLGWYFLGGSSTPDVTEMSTNIDLSVDGVDVGEQFTGVIDGIKTTVGGITDQASAEAALPQLEGFNTQLDDIAGMAGNLPEAAQGPFQGIVSAGIELIKPVIDNAIEASGAGSILQPIVDSMMEKLTGMAG